VRLSKAYIPTQKEIPSYAVIPSHRLMLRAGLIRPLASGIYSYLPLGWMIMKKIMKIIREEMDRIGAQELYLPSLNPIEIWDETGRNSDFGDEIFRLKDRKNRALVLAPTHEEVICDLARKYIHSYKDLPQIWYQIQTKMRDEPRPRAGVIRSRQFIMKDSYTLDADSKGLDKAYEAHAEAYKKIFSRCHLDFYMVAASSGLMGGSGSHEFMVESVHGEDIMVLCKNCDYASNLEVAESIAIFVKNTVSSLKKVHTPESKSIEEVSKFLKMKPQKLMKSLVYIRNNTPVIVLIRGDHEVNTAKLQGYLGGMIRPAHPDEIQNICGADVGFIGPVGLSKPIRIVADKSLKNQHNLCTGANETHYHLTGIELDRDVNVKEYTDLRNVLSEEKCPICNGTLRVTNAIELGHIFKLGTKYSKSMKVLFLDSNGKERPVIMGSYGIGVERILATFIEQNHDDYGIIWNMTLNPYCVHIIPINFGDKEIQYASNEIYNLLKKNMIDTVIDDRDLSPGYKFKEADLLGMPLQIVISNKLLKNNQIEITIRKTREKTYCAKENVITTVKSLLKSLKN